MDGWIFEITHFGFKLHMKGFVSDICNASGNLFTTRVVLYMELSATRCNLHKMRWL